ncbi:hypothetical protein JTE90_010143 [Oedothorax gibbosus]|uniref:Uncharacterized protein n=1 Tax=Oedothorax gibbosus TaxID=931172 RepID=A0AAV6UHM1_9ARAC|nr:hypothetical protein JTE90_010143 [Oedothorax gibbosus]
MKIDKAGFTVYDREQYHCSKALSYWAVLHLTTEESERRGLKQSELPTNKIEKGWKKRHLYLRVPISQNRQPL